MPTFAGEGCCVVSTTDLYGRIIDFLGQSRYFLFKVAPQYCTHEAEWTPFQIHYFSENLVALGIPGPLDLYPGTLTTNHRGGLGEKHTEYF
jgi:hypothetical protein